MNNKYIHEREIWLVDLEPTKGVEIKKVRPCLIMRKFSNSHVIVAPLTSQKKKSEIFFNLSNISFLKKDSWVCVNQIRTIDGSRCIKRYGVLPSYKFKEIQKISGEVLKLLPKGAIAQETKRNSLSDQNNDPSLIQEE